MNHEQAYSDHRYLWTAYGPAADMTGGYVDQGDLEKLLRSPTKYMARVCLIRQIVYWFEVGTDDKVPIDVSDPRLLQIAERHGCDPYGVPGAVK
jgi:hypothetical protein